MGSVICLVAGCGNPAHGRGYCNSHYHRLVRYGEATFAPSPTHRRNLMWDEIDLVDKLGPCWVVTSHRLDSNGYIRLRKDGTRVFAHRMVMENFLGHGIPDGVFVCHHCDVRNCIRPDHLFLRTASDNISDCSAKGRHFNGSKTHCSNGHPYEGDNLGGTRDGARTCRQCRRNWEAQRRMRTRTRTDGGGPDE